jgi:hypothetical protein
MKKPAATFPFMGATKSKTPSGFDAVIFGAPHGTPYKGIDNRLHAGSAKAFRTALAADAEWLDHWDYDLGGTLLAGGFRLADLGDLATTPKDGAANRKRIEATTRRILDAGAIPIMFGGDDSTPIPFIAGFAGGPPLTILQIDAHIDWRDERHGERNGFSSTMQRASEQPHVWRIVQAGARRIGSARAQEVADARQWGAHIVTARKSIATVSAPVRPHPRQIRLPDQPRLRRPRRRRCRPSPILARQPHLYAGDRSSPVLPPRRHRRFLDDRVRGRQGPRQHRRLHRRAHRLQCYRQAAAARLILRRQRLGFYRGRPAEGASNPSPRIWHGRRSS